MKRSILCAGWLALFWVGGAAAAQPAPEVLPPLRALPAHAGADWVGGFEPRDDLQPDRAVEASGKSAYRHDPRIVDMLGAGLRRQQADWKVAQAADPQRLAQSESDFRHVHHAGSAAEQDALTLTAEPESLKSSMPVRVLLRRAADGTPQGGIWVFNATLGRFDQSSASGELRFDATPGTTYALHVAARAPVAMRRVNVAVEAERSDYTVDLADGEPVELRVRPPSGSFQEGFYAYFEVDGAGSFARWLPVSAVDQVAFAPGAVVSVRLQPPLPFYLDSGVHNIGSRRGTIEVSLDRGVLLEVPMAGQGSATVKRERSGQWFFNTGGSGLLRVLAPRDEPVRIEIQPPAPQLPKVLRGQRYTQDQRLELDFETGVAVTLDLRDATGQPRSMDVAVVAGGGYHSRQRVNPGERVAVPRGREVLIEAADGQSPAARHKGRFEAPGQLTLQAPGKAQVSGRVVASDGVPPFSARVQAQQGGVVVASDTLDSGGRYRLTLPLGEYELVAFHESFTLPVALPVPTPIRLTGADLTQDLVLQLPQSTLQVVAPPACHRASTYRMPLTLADTAGRLWVRHIAVQGDGLGVPLRVTPGRYRVTLQVPGYPRWEGDLTVAESGITRLDPTDIGECRSWQGRLLDADGQPVAGLSIRFDDAAQELIGWAPTDAEGRFSLPLTEGFSYEFRAPESGRSLRHVRSIERLRSSFREDVRLQALEFAGLPQPQPGAQLVYGDAADGSRFDIVFVAEGYVARQETFTDSNGNGLWDGLLFADINGNGVWDQGEPFSSYGDASPPGSAQSGTDIRTGNEPFVDLNGDGYPNLDDPAVFGLNIQNFMRELLSLPFWAERRDAFNAWAVWVDSEQAGMDLIATDGSLIEERRTAFGGRWLQDRSLLSVDYGRVEAVLAEQFPHAAQRVVLMNQPVAMGRANAYILYYGGLPGASVNSTVASHELGHALGLLADEYQEFRGNQLDVESAAPNLTRVLEPDLARWRISAEGPGPHAFALPGQGWFEGGGYYQGGVYRPSHKSTMRFNQIRFNTPSLDALAKEACARLGDCRDARPLRSGVWWQPDESGWGLFAVDQGDVLAVAWFTYGEDGRPSWFLLPASEQDDGRYRAPVLRFTGTPLAEIGPGAVAEDSRVGEAELRFAEDERLAFSYRIGTAERSVQMDPFPFAGTAPRCVSDGAVQAVDSEHVSDVWWNPQESGWGLFLNQRGNQLFAAWYSYAEDGSPLFLIATAEGDGEVFRGPVFRQQNGTPYTEIAGQPASPGADTLGEVEFRFTNGRSGRFRYTLGDLQQEKAIERLRAGRAAPICGDR